MKIFVTGGTGNIGQYVSIAAAEKGHEVVVLSRTPDKYAGLAEYKGISLVKGFIDDYYLLGKYIKDCDAVVHIALGWGNEPVSMCMEDTVPTINLLEIAEKAGVKKFIYTSSTAVIGRYEYNMNEKTTVSPSGLYGSTKAASEAYVLGFREYNAESGTDGDKVTMKRNVIRPGYTFSNPPYEGASTQFDSRFHDITDSVVKGYPIQLVKNDGTQFLSAQQIAKIYMAVLENDSGLNEEIFFALSNTYVTWERIAKIAIEEYPTSESTVELYDKGYDSKPMMFDVGKIKEFFGLEFTGEDEIREHVRWNIENSLGKLKVN